MQNIRVKANGKFPDMASAVIGIENFVETYSIIAGCFNNFAVLEFEFHILKRYSII
ncbi:hypothetical protein D3C74_428080 [compost metagenome]